MTTHPASPALAAWLGQRTALAPEVLRRRVTEYAAAAPADLDTPAALGQAGSAALERVLAAPGDRSVALDLLAADALVTLALLAQAEAEPSTLGRFAADLLVSQRPGA